ncbi:hypothetical protein SAMN05444287_1479 [Octadecabacter temperatus]|uniref:Uncharacterized protein n=1 Tax=Octadecabacter temperatus TaxID=1458307 RepID=A0A0K0Y5X6_9RHOB|nr:hypothetical protein OSB_18230 [Octadecabacter temperatus]SIO12624.1 hypothetical protein SAMN05444287_1479 [Octadecabacter temperatus]
MPENVEIGRHSWRTFTNTYSHRLNYEHIDDTHKANLRGHYSIAPLPASWFFPMPVPFKKQPSDRHASMSAPSRRAAIHARRSERLL